MPLLVCPLLVVGCFDAHTNDDPCRADAWVCCDPGRFGEPAPTGCPLECPRGYRLVPRGECGHDAGLPVLDAWV
ncbi:MAG: hypothetical protein R3B82_17740, partial [Sandaracinaceae bacterium]